MNIEVAREMKKVVELEIGRLITAFEAETGMAVDSIEVHQIYHLIGKSPRFAYANIVTESL